STSYQWIKANSFTNAGGQQKVTIADHSDPGLIVDAVRLVRRTPYDRQSAAQALFAAGSVALGPAEEVVFNGVNTGLPRLQNPGRVSIVQVNATTVYAYYRQEIASEKFQIYMATSTDGGKTFTVRPDPVIRLQSVAGFTEPLQTAYDQQVTKRPDGYYMVFEGAGLGCEFSAMSAFSPDGINNWQVRNVSVCDKMGQEGSASVPTYYVDVETGTEYLQWVSPNYIQQITRSYQTSLPTGLFKGQLTFTADAQMAPYALPQSPPGSWDAPLFGTTGVYYEDGYYYASHNLANRYNCDGRWAIGVARTATPGTVSSWKKSLKNPLLLAGDVGTCWMEYPSIVMLPSGLYLYYYDGYTNYLPDNRNNRSIFRRKLLPN
ncbi:MAG: hypothetical protein ACLGI6_18000, partial [Gammaproteobacteria bacterium]